MLGAGAVTGAVAAVGVVDALDADAGLVVVGVVDVLDAEAGFVVAGLAGCCGAAPAAGLGLGRITPCTRPSAPATPVINSVLEL